MTVRKYNKLVRDRIPDGIAAKGEACEVEILSEEEYLARLEDKLDEELAEFHESKTPDELADLVEVVRAIAKAKCWSWEQLERIRREKLEERGGFDQRLLLKKVYTEESREFDGQTAGWLMDRFTQQQ